MKAIICHTPGCLNNGVVFLWDYDTAAAQAEAQGYTLGQPTCGACNHAITDQADHAGTSSGDGGFTEQPTA